jgi:xanthine/CO dehydrogenase XdhC/CoxF family maturation factor
VEYDDGLIVCAGDALVIFDPHRPRKDVAVVLDLGERVKPVITPDDPGQLVELLRRHGVQVSGPA